MHSPRLWQLLVVACSVQASIAPQKRQDSNVGGLLSGTLTSATGAASTGIQSSTSSAAAVTQSTTSVPASTSAALTTTTSSQTTTTSISVPPTTSRIFTSSSAAALTTTSTTEEAQQITTTEPTDDDVTTPTSTTFERTSSTTHTTTDSPEETNTHSRIVTTKYVLLTKTNSDGSKSTMTSSEITTSTTDLNVGDDNDHSAGISVHTRNTIIGVVVGVGGAIILGALGLVAWRVWGRRRNGEETEAFMPFGQNEGYAGLEKSDHGSTTGVPTQSSPSPFQSTLEDYHQPSSNKPVNAASNF